MSHPDAPRNEAGVASLLLGLVGLITCWMMLGCRSVSRRW